MGIPKIPKSVNLIVGIISSFEEIFEEIKKNFSSIYGETDFESSIFSFHHTSYYEKEMGNNLKKKFFSFEKLIKPDILPIIKKFSNTLETNYTIISNKQDACSTLEIENTKKRQVNIDPGYISQSKLILATTKDYQHRIYLSDGIFAEVTLRYTNKTFTPWEWTYPDYKTEEYINFFNEVRKKYMEKLTAC